MEAVEGWGAVERARWKRAGGLNCFANPRTLGSAPSNFRPTRLWEVLLLNVSLSGHNKRAQRIFTTQKGISSSSFVILAVGLYPFLFVCLLKDQRSLRDRGCVDVGRVLHGRGVACGRYANPQSGENAPPQLRGNRLKRLDVNSSGYKR